MKVLYLDCFSGVSGDMLVGALTDLGVQPSTFEWELTKVDIGDFHMHFEKGSRHGITGIHFSIHEGATHVDHAKDHGHGAHGEHEHAHGHTHDHEEDEGHNHGHHHHGHDHHHEEEEDHHAHHHHEDEDDDEDEHVHGRSHREIRELISASDLSPFVKEKSLAIFERIAVAEGKIHSVPPGEVAFHEIGALDSIADILFACIGIEALGVEKVIVSKLVDGTGWIQCAHGRLPIPGPATLEILAGIPVTQTDVPFELITPTGAGILAEFGTGFSMMPPLKVQKIGYGVGSRYLPDRPNVLRAILAEIEPESSPTTDTITQIETNIDDLSPELTGAIVDRLLGAGALDAFLTPVQMKKNRPGVLLTVLAEPAVAPALIDLIFRETSSFGVRTSQKSRVKLAREIRETVTEFGPVKIKLGFLHGQIVQRAPEFESCRSLAESSGKPLRVIYEAALVAAEKI
ncbi:MAG TPA: nickel pincer cofactor biosynthesis protein LarC [Chthoniobacterales bacterium]